MSFIKELKRRNVFRVAAMYTVVGWLLVQVALTFEEVMNLPRWFDSVVLSFLIIAFPIALIFAWAFEMTPEGIRRTAKLSNGADASARASTAIDVALIIGLVMVAAAILLPPLLLKQKEGPPAIQSTGETPSSIQTDDVNALTDASIAVLPFADLSAKGDQEYFGDGISEEILNVLAQVKGMKVAGRTSSFAFKGQNQDLREIGRILNVAHILEGSVRSQGEAVRVTAQLIQVSDGFHLWSQTYDRNLTDIFAVQDDIAQQILVAMTKRLGIGATPNVTPAKRTDITAYNLFLESRDLIFTRDVSKMARAIELLGQAISIDETYAPAYAARAKALTLSSDRPGSYGAMPAQEALPQALRDAEKALQLDPNLADGHAVMGLINADVGKPDFAVSSLRRALELNPNSLDARNWLSIALNFNGRLRDVTDQVNKLVEIDPLYRPGVGNSLTYNIRTGDIDVARSAAEHFVRFTNDADAKIRIQSRLARLNGDFATSIRLLESLGSARERDLDSDLRIAYLDLGVTKPEEGAGKARPVYAAYEFVNRAELAAAVVRAKQTIEEFPDFVVAHAEYVRILSIARQDDLLATYFEEKYDGELERFATLLRPSVTVDPPPYKELALAMLSTGNVTVYERAMERWRFTLDMFNAGGDVSAEHDIDESNYWAIQDNEETSLDFLESALKKAQMLPVNTFIARAYDPLQNHPRFLKLRKANTSKVNAVRQELKLAPLTQAYYDRFQR